MNASLSLMDIVHARKLLNPEKNMALSRGPARCR